jgi:hypothetical protein
VTAVPSSGDTVTQTFNAPATSYTITGLQSEMTYNISLFATNADGNSESDTIEYTTMSSILDPPTDLSDSGRTTSSITVGFTEPVGLVDSYTITAIPTSGETVIQTFNAPEYEYTITGLQPTMVYTISMVSTNSDGDSLSSTTITTNTRLPAPSNLNATVSTDTSISISWETLYSSFITEYLISAVPDSGTTLGFSASNTATSYTMTGLQSNMGYTISMIAIGTIDNSDYTPTIYYSTLPN